MFLNKDTLKMLSQIYKGDDLVGFLRDVDNEAEATKAKIRQLDQETEEEKQRHKEAMRAIGQKYADVSASCNHYQTTYYPDPSGNNDSSITCDICGKEVTRAERNRWLTRAT